MNLPIHLTENDLHKLRRLLHHARSEAGSDPRSLDRLEGELDRAVLVQNDAPPPDLITMNSRVEMINLATGATATYTLVFPEYANSDDGHLSVLAPLGMAMIGYRSGDEFSWPAPGGLIRFRVGKVLGKEPR